MRIATVLFLGVSATLPFALTFASESHANENHASVSTTTTTRPTKFLRKKILAKYNHPNKVRRMKYLEKYGTSPENREYIMNNNSTFDNDENKPILSNSNIMSDLSINVLKKSSGKRTAQPSDSPTAIPSFQPTAKPTQVPTDNPSAAPSKSPTTTPSKLPSFSPSATPSTYPSVSPSELPTMIPSMSPTSCQVLLNTYNCVNSDCRTLRTIFESMNGCEWTIRTNWLMNDDYCTWYGVTCTSSVLNSQGYEITELNLSRNNMHGTIPSTISRLWHLDSIDLSYNYLTGTIPTSLGTLPSLQVLHLLSNSYNTLIDASAGVVPCEGLSRISTLAIVSADCGIPAYVECTCCNLCHNTPSPPSHAPGTDVSLAPTYNLLPSSSPSVSSMPTCAVDVPPSAEVCEGYNLRSTCEALHELYVALHGCQWNMDTTTTDVTRALFNTNSTARSNNITSILPEGYVGTKEWFTGTPDGGIEDPFCTWYGISCEDSDCTNGCDVTKIELWNVNLQGAIPDEVQYLYQLRILELHDNPYLRGSIPTTLALLPSLQVLRLDGTSITGKYTDDDVICNTLVNNGSGTLTAFWMDCTGVGSYQRDTNLQCDCCSYCTYAWPSDVPSTAPSTTPSDLPSISMLPSATPTMVPSTTPSDVPTQVPSVSPTNTPSTDPSSIPTMLPSITPSEVPTQVPSLSPTESHLPSMEPSSSPSVDPTSGCYEPSNYLCQVSIDDSIFSYDCVLDDAKSACYIDRCINDVEVPSRVCCGCHSPEGSDEIVGLSVRGNFFPSSQPSSAPTSEPSISSPPTRVPSAGPSAIPTLGPTITAGPTQGCYEPVNYQCQVHDRGSTTLLRGAFYDCNEPTICDVVSCYSSFSNYMHPAAACCHCQDPARVNRGLTPPSESPSRSPLP